MKKVFIVLINVDFHDSRMVCEKIQNQEFDSIKELKDTLIKELDDDFEENDNHPLIYSLSDFMDEVNDQLLDDMSSYFISYVTILN
jgi:hypothetical protein